METMHKDFRGECIYQAEVSNALQALGDVFLVERLLKRIDVLTRNVLG